MNFGYRICDFGLNASSHGRAGRRAQSAIRNPQSAITRRGFSFPEVLFAVIVLGIGFIMIAAVFPVALTQSKATKEETTAASYAQQAVEIVKRLGEIKSPVMFPPTNGEMWSVDPSIAGGNAYLAARGGLISSTDPRFAYAVFYKRKTGDAFAQVTVIVAQSQGEGRNTFDGNIMSGAAANNACDIYQGADLFYNLRPRPVRVKIKPGDPVGTITIEPLNQSQDGPYWVANAGFLPAAAAPGAFVVIRNDRITNTGVMSQNNGRMNGRLFRIGQPVPGTTNQFELDPAWDFRGDPGYDELSGNNNDIPSIGDGADPYNTVNNPAIAYVLGRPIVALDPSFPRNLARVASGEAKFEGPAMDVAVYTTFIKVE